jgi:hypothetical protein
MFNSAYVEMQETGRAKLDKAVEAFLASGGKIQEVEIGATSSKEVLAKMHGSIPFTNHDQQKKRNPSQYNSTRDKGARTLASLRTAMLKGMTTEQAAEFAGVTKNYAFKIIGSNKLRQLNPNVTPSCTTAS